VPKPLAVSFVHTNVAEKGTAGSVELYVEMGHELTGHGVVSPGVATQHGLSAQARV